jgi:hypothetical protein
MKHHTNNGEVHPNVAKQSSSKLIYGVLVFTGAVMLASISSQVKDKITRLEETAAAYQDRMYIQINTNDELNAGVVRLSDSLSVLRQSLDNANYVNIFLGEENNSLSQRLAAQITYNNTLEYRLNIARDSVQAYKTELQNFYRGIDKTAIPLITPSR